MAEKENKKINEKELFLILLGISLIAFVIITATIQTVIGHFFTYILSYLFGLFYPVILVLLFAFGVYLVFSRKLPNKIESKKYIIAIILLFVALFSFGSYYFILDNHFLRLSDLIYVYNDKMKAFSSSTFEIDNFNGLGGLGGGFVGLFFVLLFGSIWGYVGDAIFFSLMIITSIFLFVYDPLKRIINNIRDSLDKRKEEKYISPYNRKNTTENQPRYSTSTIEKKALLENSSNYYSQGTFIQDKKILKPIPDTPQLVSPTNIDALDQGKNDNFIHKSFTENSAFDDYYQDTLVKEEKKVETSPFAPSPFSEAINTNEFSINDNEVDNNKNQYNPFNDQIKDYNPQDYLESFKKDEIFETAQDYEVTNPYSKNEEKQTTPNIPKPNIFEEDISTSETNKSQIEEQTTKEDNNFDDYYMDEENEVNISNNEPVQNIEENYEYTSNENSYNQNTYSNNNSNNEFSIDDNEEYYDEDDDEVVEIYDPNKEVSISIPQQENKQSQLSEKEIIAQKTREYFQMKAREMNEKRNRRLQEIERRKADLMQFVSPRPKKYSYQLPSSVLLQDIDDSSKLAVNKAAARDKMNVINNVFKEFGFEAKIQHCSIGASFTRFQVETAPGVKADRLNTLAEQIQIALNGDPSVRVQTVVEGTKTSAIEVKNAKTMTVPFKWAFNEISQNTTDRLLLPIGKDISSKMITYPLNEMPHLLIAGTTGSGKSVLVHSIITTLIMRNYPNQLKLMLIDPKQVEFTKYEMEPHLFCPIITSAEDSIVALEKLISEMERRYAILSRNNCVKIAEYRKKRIGFEDRLEELPDIVCIIDEFADLMITGGDAVSTFVQRLTAKARAAGIYLIIATQRPSKDAIPMIVKANIVCRIGLSCSTQVDSRVILDENGAETLVGKGDLLFKSPTNKSLIRCQAPFISEDDINHVVNYLKQNAGTPSYNADFLEFSNEELENDFTKEKTIEQKYAEVKEYVMFVGYCSQKDIAGNFSLSAKQASTFISNLIRENIIVFTGNGQYEVIKRI